MPLKLSIDTIISGFTSVGEKSGNAKNAGNRKGRRGLTIAHFAWQLRFSAIEIYCHPYVLLSKRIKSPVTDYDKVFFETHRIIG